MQNESQKTFIFIAEPQPILSKDSARRAQCKMKVKKLSFSLPSRSLSYLKIVQGERKAEAKTILLKGG